jgi:hypothetical protein
VERRKNGLFVSSAALMILLTAGCGSQPTSEETSGSRGTPITVAEPSSVPEPDTVPTPTPTPAENAAGQYRIKTEYLGRSHATFNVAINGATVGSYSTDGEADVSSFLRPGANDIKVSWTDDPGMSAVGTVRLRLQANRNGSWSDVLTREVRRSTKAGESTTTIQTTPELASSSDQASATSASVGTVGDSPTPIAATPAAPIPAALAEQYSLKIDFHPFAPGEYNVTINGTLVGSFNSDGNQDITPFLKKGPNKVEIAWKKTAEPRDRYSVSKLTIGVQRDGKWNTVANQELRSGTADGNRTVTINAK